MKDQDRIKEIESKYFEIFDKLSGVLSLKGFPNLMRMWEEYASDHQGFCIGIKSKYMLENSDIFGLCGLVIYDENFPLYHHYMILIKKLNRSQTKSSAN